MRLEKIRHGDKEDPMMPDFAVGHDDGLGTFPKMAFLRIVKAVGRSKHWKVMKGKSLRQAGNSCLRLTALVRAFLCA
jgi:hypothetical protein